MCVAFGTYCLQLTLCTHCSSILDIIYIDKKDKSQFY